jgi:hypothetical protein
MAVPGVGLNLETQVIAGYRIGLILFASQNIIRNANATATMVMLLFSRMLLQRA